MSKPVLQLPPLGLGTWMMGEHESQRAQELAALRAGFEAGARLIDTAEMYADGASESITGEALQGFREQVFLVSKILPSNAGRLTMRTACDRSRQRLGVDCIDLYLLHWPGSTPLDETIEALQDLQHRGAIKYWGVSNFDCSLFPEVLAASGGDQCSVNQIYFQLGRTRQQGRRGAVVGNAKPFGVLDPLVPTQFNGSETQCADVHACISQRPHPIHLKNVSQQVAAMCGLPNDASLPRSGVCLGSTPSAMRTRSISSAKWGLRVSLVGHAVSTLSSDSDLPTKD